MSSVLFREVPPAVDALIEERRRTDIDRFDETWDGVYVVNPLPSFWHAIVADRIVEVLRPGASDRGLVVTREVGIGRPDDHRIPDVVVGDIGDLDERRHYLRTATVVVEILSPTERVDKRSFYLASGVAEVVLVDLASGSVEWFAIGADRAGYEPVASSDMVPVGPGDLAVMLED